MKNLPKKKNNFFKKIIDRLAKSSRRFKMVILSSLLFLGCLVFLLSTLFSSYWKIWPKGVRSWIAINRLAVSVYNHSDCRDFCYFEQLEYEKEISEALSRPRTAKYLFRAIFNESNNLNWRIRALDIVLNSELEHQEDFILRAQKLLDNPLSPHQLKQKIILNFKADLDGDNYFSQLKNRLLEVNLNSDEIERSLSFLIDVEEVDLDLVLEVLGRTDQPSLVRSIVLKINHHQEWLLAEKDHRCEYFVFLQNQFKTFYDYDLRGLIIFTLKSFLPEEEGAFDALEDLYNWEEIDKFSQFLISSALNSYSDEEFVYPQISPSEWEEYYKY